MQKVGFVVFGLLYFPFVRLKVKGKENLSGIKSPIILAANHTSELDVTITPFVLSFFSTFYPVYFVTNSREKYKTFGWRSLIYGGLFFNLLGGYAVYSGRKNYAIALEDHIRLLVKGRTIFIFPEGKRTSDGKMSKARGGLGYMVYVTGAKVVPVTIDSFYNLTAWEFFTFKRRVTITIGKPMYPKEIIDVPNPKVADFQAGSQKVLDRIGEGFTN